MSEKPRSLDLYPQQYWKALERIREDGRLFVPLPSAREARTIKTDWRRFRLSLQALMPDSWQAQLIPKIMVKMKDNTLEFENRELRPAMTMFEEACNSPISGTTDEASRAVDDLDDFAKRLERGEFD